MSLTRRDFVKATVSGSALVSLGAAAPGLLLRAASAADLTRDESDTVLVVVQMSGGNDGLNTVVPYGDDEYGRNRTTLRLPTEKLHKIDSLLGWHPRMEAFMRLYKEGHLSIVQGVGYANSDRSHDRAMQIWHTAEPERTDCQTGWLGRVADRMSDPNEANLPAAFVGSIARPFGLNAEKAVVPAVRSIDDLTIRPMPGRPNQPHEYDRVAELPRAKEDGPLLDFLQRSTRRSRADSRKIEAVARASTGAAGYPQFQLAQDFRTVAQLIRADLGIRIFYTEFGGGGIGGFDNHANQLGNHCALLHQLSQSVAALVNDLQRDKLLDRLLLMTFSEFGRSVAENGRRGTGHGAAQPVFLAGGKLKGSLIGAHPSLTDLDAGAPKFHTDFRRLYATALERWLGFPSRAGLGGQFEPLDVLEV